MKISLIEKKIIKEQFTFENNSIVEETNGYEHSYECYVLTKEGVKDYNYPSFDIFFDFTEKQYILYVVYFDKKNFKSEQMSPIKEHGDIIKYLKKFYMDLLKENKITME